MAQNNFITFAYRHVWFGYFLVRSSQRTLEPLRMTWIKFFLTTAPPNSILRPQEYRNDPQLNSPHQHLRKCIQKSIENMQTDFRVWRVHIKHVFRISPFQLCYVFLLISQPFNLQDLISNSPYCLPYSSCDVSLENLVLDQLIIP